MKVRRIIISAVLILSILASTVVMLCLDSDKEETKLQYVGSHRVRRN